MNVFKMIIVTLAVALGTYAPTQAQSQQARSGSVIIILEGLGEQQFDYQSFRLPSTAIEIAEKQLFIFDDKGNCIYKQYITTEIVTVGLHELKGLPYRFLLLISDQKIEGKY